MAAIIRRLKRRAQSSFVRSGGLLNDISKSEEHFGADSLRWDALTSILQLRRTAYCPAEPASSMDIALRAAGIYRRMELKASRVLNIIDLCSAHVLVTCYSVYIGQDFYNAGRRKEVVQAADFLIKEAESCSRKRGVVEEYADSFDEAEALFHREERAGR
jgi:hypothetical protein